MNVLVDTSAWSLALRRSSPHTSPMADELADLVVEGRVVVLGLIRQELLSGIRHARQFDKVRDRLRAFPDLPLVAADHEEAAAFCNRCRAKGIQGSTIDFLICAAAARRDLPILTTDANFSRYARVLPIHLYGPRPGRAGADK